MKKKSFRSLALLFVLLLLAYTPVAGAADSAEDAMQEIAVSLGASLSQSGLKKLGVAELTDLNGYRSALGPFLAEELTSQLFERNPAAFDFVERQRVAQVLAEQKLSSSSLFEAGSLATLGKTLGIQALITGSIADLGEEIKINIRVVSVESARIVASASAKFPKAGPALTLLRQSGGSGKPEGLAARSPQSSDVFFRNDFLQITVDSISIKDSYINLALVVENISTTDVTLGLYRDNAKITSSHGGAYDCRSVDGIGNGYSDDWTLFSAQSRTIVALSFGGLGSSEDDAATGGYYSFSAKFKRKLKDEVYFSVGLAGIRLDPQKPTS